MSDLKLAIYHYFKQKIADILSVVLLGVVFYFIVGPVLGIDQWFGLVAAALAVVGFVVLMSYLDKYFREHPAPELEGVDKTHYLLVDTSFVVGVSAIAVLLWAVLISRDIAIILSGAVILLLIKEVPKWRKHNKAMQLANEMRAEERLEGEEKEHTDVEEENVKNGH